MRLVLASGNRGKLAEFAALLRPLEITLLPQSDFDVGEVAEPHSTFIENAIAKARHVCRVSGLPALADDSGLCVRALGGAPGIRSARYADGTGELRADERNNVRLLSELDGEADRSAVFVCVLALLRDADDPRPVIAEGEWAGEILTVPRGHHGFGYDPLFLIPDLGQTAAELDADTKNVLSHRGMAARRLMARLATELAYR